MCTAITLKNEDFYFGRNLDWENSFGENIVITPRNYPVKFSDNSISNNHYALIGTACTEDGYPLYFDGTNECGLSIAGLNFPGFSVYKSEIPDKINIASYELIIRILSEFDSVSKAVGFLKNVNITDKSFSSSMPPSPLHWIIADKNDCYVIEPVVSGVKLYKNEYGVLTNSPSFDMHIYNLSNYMHISSSQVQNLFCENLDFIPYSRGLGAVGLPGDWSSSSRFVRAVFEKTNSVSSADEMDSVGCFFHILSSVENIKGCVRTEKNEPEITQYSSCCNTQKGIYYYTTYHNRRICAIDMHKENLDGDSLVLYPFNRTQDILYVN